MAMTWHNRDEANFSHNEEDKASFQRHDESMKRFSLNHHDWESAQAKIEKTVDYFTLLPIRRVNLDRISSN